MYMPDLKKPLDEETVIKKLSPLKDRKDIYVYSMTFMTI